MGNVLYATPMCGHALLSRSAMNAILVVSKGDARYAAGRVFQMRTTARSACRWKKTAMDAPK